jgi:hypothetical protein
MGEKRDAMYEKRLAQGHEWIMSHCFFCEEKILMGPMDIPIHEIGEFWSEKLQTSVLAHPDCLPEGVLEGTNDEWSMA